MNKISDPLVIDHVTVNYEAFKAVDDISFSVNTGEIFGLAGVNGAGKTSLIKTIVGLRGLDHGNISIFGVNNINPAVRYKIAYMPEKFEPPWFLSGYEFLRFSRQLYKEKITKAECGEAAEEIGLDPDFLPKRVQSYSKGMRQKLGLLGTITTPADLLILDEPMSGLDPLARLNVKDMLRSINKKGKTLLISSHILADMDEICDRMAVLHGKKINFVGSPAELKKKVDAESLERAFLNIVSASA